MGTLDYIGKIENVQQIRKGKIPTAGYSYMYMDYWIAKSIKPHK